MARLIRLDRLTELQSLESSKQGSSSPRILHRLSPRVAVVQDEEPTPFDVKGLDHAEKLIVGAWQASRVAKAPGSVRVWNAAGFSEPVHMDTADAGPVEAPEAERTLTGSIAIGLVLVSGPDAPVQLPEDERQKVLQEVLQATQFLVEAEPRAKLSFEYDVQHVTVDIAAGTLGTSTDPYERKEAPWRDAALKKMGYDKGRKGYRKYVADLKANRRTNWAFVAFFTRYPLNHFAYAVDEKVVMHYQNDNWGPNEINAVFAHETCHIFGAADEYGNCGCKTTHGALKAPNGNCVACTTPHIGCLMDRNELTLCSHSRLQLGWGPPHI